MEIETALQLQQQVDKIISGDRTALSRSITLVESTRPEDRKRAERLISAIIPHAVDSWRIAVTGIPGVGKSTFIDSFGPRFIAQGKKVAVLAVDPSSSVSGGSILGDKTRMERLSASNQAYVRPSPTSSNLGGVAKRTRESILLCEAAGYNVIFIETVGVGQSETIVHSMSDMFLLLMLAGAGDELQGIKRGIMEMADVVAINKAEGDDLSRFRESLNDYRSALHLMPPLDNGWTPKVEMISALKETQLDKLMDLTSQYFELVGENGSLEERRKNQKLNWFKSEVVEQIQQRFFGREGIKEKLKTLESEITGGKADPYTAIGKLFD